MKYWHKFRLFYLNTLYRDCIDENIKEKLLKKIKHHENRLYKSTSI